MTSRRFRGIDNEEGWIRRALKDLQDQINRLGPAKTLEASSVDGGVVTIREVLIDPAGAIGAWDVDTTTAAADDTTVVLTLTYVPLDRAVIVRHNGVVLEADEFTREGTVITIAPSSSVTIRTDDRFSAWYLRDRYAPEPPPPPPVTLVGVNSAAGPLSELALPVGWAAGDTVVLGTCNWTAGSSADPRLTLQETFPGQFVDIGRVYTGTLDASGDPIALSVGSLHDFTCMAVFRNASVLDVVTDSDTAPAAAAANAPAVAAARAVACVALMRTGVTTGGITHTPGDLTTVVAGTDGGGQVNMDISWWSEDDPQTSPADDFAFGGSIDGWGLATIKLAG